MQRIDTTLQVVKTLTMAALPAASAVVAHDGINAARNIAGDSALKAQIKDQFSNISSLNLLLSLYSAFELVQTVINTNVLKGMSAKERALFGFIVFAGLAGTIYSASRIGVEHNTFAAGLAEAGAILLFGTANLTAKTIAHKQSEDGELRPLLSNNNI